MTKPEKKFTLLLATGLGVGFVPKIPGFFGALLGLLFFMGLRNLSILPFMATLTALFFLAVWVSALAEGFLGEKDPHKVVIDEIVGMIVSLSFVPFTWKAVLAGFVLFRIFDVWKPFPVRLIQDRLPGGWGVVGDDVMAGVYANLFLQVVARFGW